MNTIAKPYPANLISFQDWLKTAYRHGQISVIQDGNGEWIIHAPTPVLDQAFHWLAQRQSKDNDSRAEFLITEVLEECTNNDLINTLFDVLAEKEPSEPTREALLRGKRDWAQKQMNMHLRYLMRLSGKSDIAGAQYAEEQNSMHADADDAGILMSGRSHLSFNQLFADHFKGD
jgi:hypothetical protein